jgi:hypothetical protein
VGRAKSIPTVWRDAIRDDPQLSPPEKLIACILGTFMDAAGFCYPSVDKRSRVPTASP